MEWWSGGVVEFPIKANNPPLKNCCIAILFLILLVELSTLKRKVIERPLHLHCVHDIMIYPN